MKVLSQVAYETINLQMDNGESVSSQLSVNGRFMGPD